MKLNYEYDKLRVKLGGFSVTPTSIQEIRGGTYRCKGVIMFTL